MVFSGLLFLIFFLTALILCYFPVGIISGKIKTEKAGRIGIGIQNGILLVFSLFFYAWGEPKCVFLLIFSSFVDYIDGILLEKFKERPTAKKICLGISLLINLSLLGIMKYTDFFIGTVNRIAGTDIPLPGIALPIGISFYTFQTTSYSIDVYRGKVNAERNFFRYLTYISMFSQLIAGPIVRYSLIKNELTDRKTTLDNFTNGFRRFLIGLFRKVLIANELGALWDYLRGVSNISVAGAWLGFLIFTLQLYYDFSAYSDMAIGLGLMMGFHFDENFRYPLSALSITDFWRRWHISLSGWFRDYVYIPLGGNRKGRARQLINLGVVWFLTGLWHGAFWNYVLWGLYHGSMLVLEKFIWGRFLEKAPKFLRHIYTLIIVIFGFGLFYFEDMSAFGTYLTYAFGMAGNAISGPEILWAFGNYLPVIVFAVVFMFPVFPKITEFVKNLGGAKKNTATFVAGLVSVGLLILCIANLVRDSYNPFLYFRF
ncbi:MAG: MBOAT family protein [Lachnospiraceae bacterium]|nr:MBOAT family protein [Lachnospiraceae bacterium]